LLGPPDPPSSGAGGGDGSTVDVVTVAEVVGDVLEVATSDGANVPP
jgi:hypothetical protein